MLAAATAYGQGIVLVEQQTRQGKSTTSMIQLEKTRMRAESRASGESMAFTFDDSTKILRAINLEKKTYMELNDSLRQQMQQQMSKLQEQLQALPPQQRAALEQAMRGRGGMPGIPGGPAAKIEYKQTGSDKAGSWPCTKYDGYQGPQKVIEICAVDPSAMGLSAGDFEVAKRLAEFLQSFLPQAASQIVVAGAAGEQGFSGIPVRRTTYSNGAPDTVSEIKEVRREAIPASVFDVPAGFKRDAPMMGR
jgi:hypothetical protein